MKLAGKLILLFIVAVIAVTMLASYFTSQQFILGLEQRHREIADSIARERSDVRLHQAIESGDRLYFQRMASGVGGDGLQVRWVWFEESDSRLDQPQIEDETALAQAKEQVTTLTVNSQRGRTMFTYCPVKHGGRSGAIEIISSLNSVEADARTTWIMALISIAAMGLLSIGVVMTAGVRWIARPLEALTKKMQRVGNGDFSSDLNIRSNDELGQLASAVNHMCDRLRDQQSTIENETERRLATLNQLRHADRLKTVGQLAAGLAHEVGTPLNVVSGRASMILSDPMWQTESAAPAQKIAEHAAAIKAESDRISSIIQKLLAFARRTPSRQLLGDLRDVVRHAVDLLYPLAEKKQVKISAIVPNEIAEAKFDFNQMQQVVMNLIDNAIEVSDAGQAVCVELKAVAADVAPRDSMDGRVETAQPNSRGQGWSIEVSDQGPGIPTAFAEEIFEPFYTTKDVGAGTGLGLSIVHGIVLEHGGDIRFENLPGGGTKFTVRL